MYASRHFTRGTVSGLELSSQCSSFVTVGGNSNATLPMGVLCRWILEGCEQLLSRWLQLQEKWLDALKAISPSDPSQRWHVRRGEMRII